MMQILTILKAQNNKERPEKDSYEFPAAAFPMNSVEQVTELDTLLISNDKAKSKLVRF